MNLELDQDLKEEASNLANKITEGHEAVKRRIKDVLAEWRESLVDFEEENAALWEKIHARHPEMDRGETHALNTATGYVFSDDTIPMDDFVLMSPGRGVDPYSTASSDVLEGIMTPGVGEDAPDDEDILGSMQETLTEDMP